MQHGELKQEMVQAGYGSNITIQVGLSVEQRIALMIRKSQAWKP